jgi:hypothetical protein
MVFIEPPIINFKRKKLKTLKTHQKLFFIKSENKLQDIPKLPVKTGRFPRNDDPSAVCTGYL